MPPELVRHRDKAEKRVKLAEIAMESIAKTFELEPTTLRL